MYNIQCSCILFSWFSIVIGLWPLATKYTTHYVSDRSVCFAHIHGKWMNTNWIHTNDIWCSFQNETLIPFQIYFYFIIYLIFLFWLPFLIKVCVCSSISFSFGPFYSLLFNAYFEFLKFLECIFISMAIYAF